MVWPILFSGKNKVKYFNTPSAEKFTQCVKCQEQFKKDFNRYVDAYDRLQAKLTG